MKWILATVLGVVIGIGLYFYNYLGAYKPVDLKIEKFGPATLVYQENLGPYHKIISKIEQAESLAKTSNFDCHLTFGKFLDNPEIVEEARLRSEVGCLMQPELNDFSSFKNTKSIPDHFKVSTLPAQDFLIAVFEGSPAIGPQKVYPKATEFIKNNSYELSGPVFEVYELLPPSGMRTKYLFPVKKLNSGTRPPEG